MGNLFKKIVDYGVVAVVSAWGQALGNALYETGKVIYLYYTEETNYERSSEGPNGTNPQ
jgi:hypothetical protein